MKIFSLVTISIFALGFAAHAADEGLYDPVAPKGSSFIRHISSDEAFPYHIADKAEQKDRKLEDGKFYSVVKSSDGEAQIEDKPPQSRAKAVISLYNFFSENNLSLKTSDGKIAITEPAGYGEAQFRDINGTKVAIGVFEGEKKIHDIGEKSLQRGAGYTVFVSKTAAGLDVDFIEASVDTTK